MNRLVVLALYILILVVLMFNDQVAAQEGPGTVIVRPAGQDVELLCSVATPGTPQVGVTWIINFNRHGVSSLANGILDGYSADINSSNLIVKNIVMNDNRNNTEYMCVVIMSDRVVNDSDPIFLYVAGVPAVVPGVKVDNKTINNISNIITLTLSWGEPFNNLDHIVSYTVSCSGDVTCPPNFTTNDNTTRSYTIRNLTANTYYTFSVVATNSIGSGEAGVVMIGNPPSSTIMTSTVSTSTTAVKSTVNITTTESVTRIMPTLSIIATTSSTRSSSVSSMSMIATMTSTNVITTTFSPSIMTSDAIPKSTTTPNDTTTTTNTTNTTTTTTNTTNTTTTFTTFTTSTTVLVVIPPTETSSNSTSTTVNSNNAGGNGTMNTSPTSGSSSNMNQEKSDDETGIIIPIIVVIIVVVILCCCCFMGIVFCFCCVRRENHYQDEKLVADPSSSFVAFVIFGVLTFGIGLLIWYMHLKRQSNKNDKYRYYKITNVSIFVLGMYTCGISALIWWMYKRITDNGANNSEDKKDPSAIPLSSPKILSPRTDEVPSVTNELAEYDDIVATGPARAIQVPPDEEPPASAIINETYEEHPLPTGYAVVDTKDVIARQNAAANAQPLVQHQTTSSGEKYALPEKLVAKNTQIKYVELEDMPSSGRIRTNNNDVYTPYAELC